jgi:hypothetical protein
MNFIKKWLGIYHIDRRLEEMQIEINELRKDVESHRGHIVKLSAIALAKPSESKPSKKPAPKSRKKKLPSSQETE